MCMAAYDKVEGGLEPGSHRFVVELKAEVAWAGAMVSPPVLPVFCWPACVKAERVSKRVSSQDALLRTLVCTG
jgi:hypothetical protein